MDVQLEIFFGKDSKEVGELGLKYGLHFPPDDGCLFDLYRDLIFKPEFPLYVRDSTLELAIIAKHPETSEPIGIGVAFWGCHRPKTPSNLVYWMYVKPEFRRKKIGTTIYNTVVKHLGYKNFIVGDSEYSTPFYRVLEHTGISTCYV